MKRQPRILYSFGPPTADANPYTTLLGERVGAQLEVEYFSWTAALFGRHDVLHVQWPESLIRPYRRSRLSSLVLGAKLVLASAALVLGRIRGRRLVWTVHNRTPHERGPLLERAFIAFFLRLVDHRVYLNAGETAEFGRPSSVILHPDYSPVATRPPHTAEPSGLLVFGHLRPYKGVEALIDLVSVAPELGSLLVVGAAADAEYGALLQQRAEGADHVTVQPRLVPQVELDTLIAQARLVVLPYSAVYNSGSLLLALTLRTPVLVRESETTRSISDEVGPGWVSTFTGDLSRGDLERASANADAVDRLTGPDLSGRSWSDCVQRHVALYQALL